MSSSHPRPRRGEEVTTETIDGDRTVELACSESVWNAADGAPLAVLWKQPLEPPTRPSTVVLVHGLRGTRMNWNTSTRSFQCRLVEAGYATVCPELRGSGSSRAAGSPPPRSVLELLELDLLPLLEHVVQRSEHAVRLIGHSLGGILSCLAAAARPDLVDAVVALASPLSIAMNQPLIRAGARLWVAFSEAEPFRPLAEGQAMSRALMAGRRLIDRLSLPPRVQSSFPGSMEPELQAEFDENNSREPAFPGLLRDLSRLALGRSLEGLSIMDELDRVRAPVLCVAADQDELAPVVAVDALYQALGSPNKQWLLVEGLGHTDVILGRRAPALVWDAVIEWLDRD